MITPKTDWNGGADEFFNVSDYERITANLNEASRKAGIAEYVFYPASRLTCQMNYAFSGIAQQYNKLIDAMATPRYTPKSPWRGGRPGSSGGSSTTSRVCARISGSGWTRLSNAACRWHTAAGR